MERIVVHIRNPGSISFSGNSTASNAALTAQGGANASGGSISFYDNSTASNGILVASGGLFGAGVLVGKAATFRFQVTRRLAMPH